jgi:glycosyltransferase involved in cell wall biosynthesis
MTTPSALSTSSPQVSIVLPVYNGQQYLREALQSCLDQTLTDWELLVVDDASTDDTPAIIGEFAAVDGRIRAIRHQHNRRLPAALNSGFAEARGHYLTWTSDDNRYRPEALAEMVRLLEARPSLDFVYSDYDVVDASGHFVEKVTAPPPAHFVQGYNAVPCFLYRRALYTELGGYAEDLFLAEDYEYWLRIYATRHTMSPLHLDLYEYRRHSRSLTDVQRGRAFAASERALLKHIPDLAWAGSGVRGEVYLHLASLASWQGHRRQAAAYAVAAIRSRPLALLSKAVNYAIRRVQKRVQQLGV